MAEATRHIFNATQDGRGEIMLRVPEKVYEILPTEAVDVLLKSLLHVVLGTLEEVADAEDRVMYDKVCQTLADLCQDLLEDNEDE